VGTPWRLLRSVLPRGKKTTVVIPTDSDEPLVDTTLADEIALLGDVVAAVTAVGRMLTRAEVDAALGLPVPEPGQAGPPAQE
jgi:hypothetical protein